MKFEGIMPSKKYYKGQFILCYVKRLYHVASCINDACAAIELPSTTSPVSLKPLKVDTIRILSLIISSTANSS